MESVSNQPCTTPFPFYELHQVAHNTSEITTPSAMDILCEIVNSEYSDISYNVAPPSVGIPIHGDNDHHHIEKESLLDILYCSGSKARKIVDEDVEMLHEQQALSTTTYSMQFGSNPTNIAMHHEFSSPDMHQFKLPLLEQEPESSINNSQLDGALKTKEIRRNLERSILMHGGASVAESAVAPSCVKQGEVKLKERHEITSCSSAMMACSEYNTMDRPRKSSRPYGYNDERMKEDNALIKAKSSARLYVEEAKLLKRKASAKEVDSGSKKSTSVARIKHNITKYSEGIRVERNLGNNEYKVDAEEKSDERTRGQSSLANEGSKRIRVENSLANDGSRRGRVEGLLANDEMKAPSAYCGEKAKAGGPRMTHISVERNRRKQMNEHLGILRSLMPTSYVQRSDQASIIGGVVEFIKELQQLLASMETQKRRRAYAAEALSPRVSAGSAGPSPRGSLVTQLSPRGAAQELVATSRSPLADVEVKLAGGAHVLLRTLSHKATRGQLLHLIAALECMSLQILHLNITTLQKAVLYTFTLKIGIECRLSVDDLADVGQQIFKDIHAKRL